MDTDSWLLAGAALFGLLLASFSAVSEVALAAVSRLQLRQALAARTRNTPGEEMTDRLVGDPARYIATVLIAKLASYIVVTFCAWQLAVRLGRADLGGWVLVGLLFILLLTQLVPRAWAVSRQEELAHFLLPLIRVLSILLSPISGLMSLLMRQITPAGSSPEAIFLSEDGLRLLLNLNEDEAGVIEDEEKEMIASIFEFRETLVREVMVPRIDLVAVSTKMSMLEALDVIVRVGHSRIPAYSDSIDNITGILYAKDLLPYLRDGRTDVPIAKILRPAYFIPESKKVDELLQELQQRRVHIAIVVDEYGGTAGLATIEDLLEEIVGEIQDEYDVEEPTIEVVSEGEFLFDARVALDEVNKLLGVDLPAEGGDTLGGFIYSQLGRVPVVGDKITLGGVSVEVLSVAGRRIKQVRANRVAETATEGGNGATIAILPFGWH